MRAPCTTPPPLGSPPERSSATAPRPAGRHRPARASPQGAMIERACPIRCGMAKSLQFRMRGRSSVPASHARLAITRRRSLMTAPTHFAGLCGPPLGQRTPHGSVKGKRSPSALSARPALSLLPRSPAQRRGRRRAGAEGPGGAFELGTRCADRVRLDLDLGHRHGLTLADSIDPVWTSNAGAGRAA